MPLLPVLWLRHSHGSFGVICLLTYYIYSLVYRHRLVRQTRWPIQSMSTALLAHPASFVLSKTSNSEEVCCCLFEAGKPLEKDVVSFLPPRLLATKLQCNDTQYYNLSLFVGLGVRVGRRGVPILCGGKARVCEQQYFMPMK